MPNIKKVLGKRFNPENVRSNSATFLGAAGTFDRPVFIAPIDGRVTGAFVSSDTTITGNDTNYWTMNVQNGATETLIDIVTTVAGGTLTANTPKEFSPSATTASRNFSAGDDLMFFGTETATATDLAAAYLNVTINWVAR